MIAASLPSQRRGLSPSHRFDPGATGGRETGGSLFPAIG
jgi:hypothetical protein